MPSARRRRRSPSRTRCGRRSCRRATTATSPGTRRSRRVVAAAKLSRLPLFLGAYPITPASSILEEFAGYKKFGVRTFQAEDEIAAAGAAVGAAFGGALGVTTSAGPGVVLKAETVGLAIMLELPLVICDIQRAGPSTGMPTKPEQGDLLMVHVRPERRVAGAGVAACRRPTASTPRSRRAGSRSSTARRSICSPTRTSRTAPSRGSCRTLETLPDISRRSPPSRTRRRVPPVPARPADARAAVGGAGHAGPRAPDRRDREGRPHREHLLRPRQPRPDDAAARAEGRGHRRRHPRARGRRPRRRREGARARLGRDVRPDRRRRAAACARGRQGRARASAPPQPVPAQHGRRAAPLREGARSRR